MNAEKLAQLFHETYERLAPAHGWKTRDECRTDWENVPKENKELMIAVSHELLDAVWGYAIRDTRRSVLVSAIKALEKLKNGQAS